MQGEEIFSENNQPPVLTMGLLVYNEEKNVAEAIENLLAQTYTNFVLLISDNASTDKTGEICQEYAQKDKRIIYVRQPENMGALFNFKYVAEHAKTPFFMWCSGNDKWLPTFVEKLMPAFENEEVILSYPEGAMIDLDGSVSLPYRDDNTTVHINNPAKRYLYFLRRFRARISNMLYGIWRVDALKRCSIDIPVVAQDLVILYEASFEGKFKMHKEVLFLMKKPVRINNTDKRMFKVFTDLTAKDFTGKKSPLSIKMALIKAILRVPFYKKYPLNMVTRLWLSFNAGFIIMLTFFIEPTINSVVKKIVPESFYLSLKSLYKKIV